MLLHLLCNLVKLNSITVFGAELLVEYLHNFACFLHLKQSKDSWYLHLQDSLLFSLLLLDDLCFVVFEGRWVEDCMHKHI